MDREPNRTGAVMALLIALPFALALAWSQQSQGPSRAELGAALSKEGGRPVKASDLRSIHCRIQSAGYACRWEQREDDVWQERTGSLATAADGWRRARE